MKASSRKSFEKAIKSCAEASMIHLEAMAKERYVAFLNTEGDTALANDFITSSYWLYQDWGAHAKALQLLQQYDFLRVGGFCIISCFFIHYIMLLRSYSYKFVALLYLYTFSQIVQHSARKNASLTLSTATSEKSFTKTGNRIIAYSFNTTSKSRKKLLVKR